MRTKICLNLEEVLSRLKTFNRKSDEIILANKTFLQLFPNCVDKIFYLISLGSDNQVKLQALDKIISVTPVTKSTIFISFSQSMNPQINESEHEYFLFYLTIGNRY